MESDTVDFLMGQKNGAEYVVLYQMLCLMCINTEGKLSRKIGEIIVPFDVDKIQRDCKYFSRDTVTIALELFKKLGLIYEQEVDGLVISDFGNLVGSETDYAVQKRIQRQSYGQLTDNNMDNVHIEKETRERVQRKSSELRVESEDKEEKIILTISNDIVSQTDVRLVIEAWNELRELGISPVLRISSTSKRYKLLVARMREYNTADILEAIEKIKSSNFLQGKNDNGWMITFDWFVKPNNFPKVLEGNYDNRQQYQSSYNGQGSAGDEWRDA